MIKDLFTGSLGKLNNHGGSRIYTTPNTILVPPEYEVDIGEHGDFISCSLDGRLWLFKNKIIALKWNEETGRMEFSASRSFNNNQFIARGIDWILTKTYIIQYNNGKIVVEAHKIKDIQPMENFYSLLPALDGFQIIKGYLIRKPGAEHTDLVYPVENAGIFLTPNSSEIWGKTSEYAGKVNAYETNGEYKLEVASTYSVSGDITGITFLNDKLYGFQLDGNHKGLCYASQNLNLYSFAYGEWETLSEATGKIYFDVFNHKALALHDKGMEILPDRKKVECNALEQWIAPTKELHYVSNNIIISALSDKVLATNLSLKYYRSLLKADKELSITATAYNSWKLAVGNVSNKLNFNSLNTTPFYYDEIEIEIELLNTGEFEQFGTISKEFAVFIIQDEKKYIGVKYENPQKHSYTLYTVEEVFYGDASEAPCPVYVPGPNGGMVQLAWGMVRVGQYVATDEEGSYTTYDVSLIEATGEKDGYLSSIKYTFLFIDLNTGEISQQQISKDCASTEHGVSTEKITPLRGSYWCDAVMGTLPTITYSQPYIYINRDIISARYGFSNNSLSFYTENKEHDITETIIKNFTSKEWQLIENNSDINIKAYGNNFYVNYHGLTTNKTFELDNTDLSFIESLNYYNVKDIYEFRHILIFYSNEIEKYVIFVFRTKLKTRSKL